MRLFFAYWPSPDKAAEIASWVERAHSLFGGRPMQLDTLHMTLAFLGETEDTLAKELVRECVHWRLPSGDMVLQTPGKFSRARVVWLGPGDVLTVPWLYDAYEQLWEHLGKFGWQKRESTFMPHISLLRNASPDNLDELHGPAVVWRPERCVLVASRPSNTRSRYEVLAEIPLEGIRRAID